MLYQLRAELARKGCCAYIYKYGRGHGVACLEDVKYLSDITDELRMNGVVVYPETVWGNPLRFRNVVRWVLNKPGLLAGDAAFHAGELVFTWDRVYWNTENILRLDAVDRCLFKDKGFVRDTDAVFVYKGGKVRDTPELEGLPVITMQWPAERTELAGLLQRTRYLYTHDLHSSILEEAIACGAKIRIVTADGYRDWNYGDCCVDYGELTRQLNEFIDKTSSMHYTGEINTRHSVNGLLLPFYWMLFLFSALSVKLGFPGKWSMRRLYYIQKVYLR